MTAWWHVVLAVSVAYARRWSVDVMYVIEFVCWYSVY